MGAVPFPLPLRTCIGCRQRAAAPELVRLVLAEGRITVASRTAREGRGASIHPREACVVAAVRTHAFARAFRAQVGVGLTTPSQKGSPSSPEVRTVKNSPTPKVVDEAVRSLIRDIEIAHEFQQPRAGRTP